MISIITAALPLTGILGSLMLKYLMRKNKARFLMLALDLAAIIAIMIQIIALEFVPLLLGRLILGFIVGVNSGLVPQYIYSVTPTALAGSVGSLHQVFLMVGVAVGYTMGFLINPVDITDQYNWRILLAFPILTCTIRSTLLFTALPYEIPSHRTKDRAIQRL